MKLKLKKLLSILLIVQVVFLNLTPLSANAQEVVATSTPESTTSSTEATTTITENTSTPAPSPTTSSNEEEHEMTEEEEEAAYLVEEAAEYEALMARRAESEARRQAAREAARIAATAVATGTSAPTSGDQRAGGAVGTDSALITGDANTSGAVINSANTNLAGSAGVVPGSGSGASVISSENGEDSTNSGSITVDNNKNTNQDNSAVVNTSLTESAVTGNNNNFDNIGRAAYTKTGDANVTGTIITSANSNVAGVMVSEFNIDDSHTGDVLLDFGAGCISGCGGGPISVANTSNGESSTNNSTVNQTNTNTTNQNNDAQIGSELVLNADSGSNRSNDNIGGDVTIETGDANIAGNVLTFANTNIAGNVIYAVVNIFGDLIGDIILTEDAINNCCGGTNLSASNTGNAQDSTNNTAINFDNNDTILQTNDAVIENNMLLDAQTGDNTTSDNIGGDSSIKTGNVDITASLLNFVNTNLIGGNMWLVLVNEGGKWIGRLLGTPEGSTIAASTGSDYTIDENGYITVTNSNNGEDSINNADVNQTNINTTTQANNANVSNTLDLSANTGGNTASDNIGGNSNIKTGDATIIANLVNFVNTNIVGGGKLVVTVVNLFGGTWLGDFITPGHKKDTKTIPTQEVARGGNNNPPSDNFNSHSEDGSNGTKMTTTQTSSNNVSGGTLTGSVKQAVAGFIGSFQGNSSVSVSGDSKVEQKVAGISTPNVKDISSNKKVTVNLAWIVLLLPVMGAVYIGRKIFVGSMLTKRIS